MKRLIAGILAIMLAAPAAFAQVDEHGNTKKGAAIGAAAGAVLGGILGKKGSHHNTTRGAVLGGAVGAAAGGVIGAMMDKQERDLRQIEGVNVQRESNDELKVTVKNEVLFDFNSAALRGTSRDSLREMADVFQKYPNTTISVQGYTDSIGSAAYNQRLSERRAGSVARYLEDLGVNSGRIDAVGYGKTHPRASNSTASGRQLNRRVEIHVRANNA